MASRLAMVIREYLISGLLSAGVIGLAYYYRFEIGTALHGIRVTWALAGLICILVNYLLRAIRLYLLTGYKLSVWPKGVYCTTVHGFVTYMLPLRSGDLSLPFLLKSTSDMDLKDGAAILYKARLLEVFTLGIWLVAASLMPSSVLPSSVMIALFLSGLMMMLLPLILKIVFRLRFIPFDRFQRVAKKLAQTSNMKFIEVLITSGIWVSIALSIWCVSASIQLSISVMEIFFLIAVQLVMQLVPIQGLANSGNHETGWVGALVLMGYPTDLALQFALTSHAIILIYAILIGLIALALRHSLLK